MYLQKHLLFQTYNNFASVKHYNIRLTSIAIYHLHPRDQSEDLASAYANRAACLLRLACPQFALTDIELALENGSDLFFS